MRRIVVVGGGVGGTMVANRLAREWAQDIRRKEIEVVVVADERVHQYQPGYLYVSLNEAPQERFERAQQRLLVPGVKLLLQAVRMIDPKHNRIVLSDGEELTYDYLVIATGSHPTLDTVPGLKEGGHTFYTADGAAKLAKALERLERGRVVVGVDVPHKCPVAPIEFTLMLDDQLRRRGIRDQVEIVYTYPIGRVHSLPAVASWAEAEFSRRGIESEVFFNLESVDADKHVVTSLEGSSYSYDILVVIPAHQGAKVVLDSGIGDEGGWIPTDRHSMRMKGATNVYVIGDATDLPVSKAGSTAHYQVDVAAGNISADLRGLPAHHHYDGRAFCFIEGGLDRATYIAFSYTEPPHPGETTEMLHWFKLMYNEIYWLALRGVM